MTLPRTVPQNWPPFTVMRLMPLLLTLLVLLFLSAHSKRAAALQRRPLSIIPAFVITLLVLVWAGACAGGGGGGGGIHDPGTTKGASTVTVTGTSGGVSHTVNLTLTVN
jgi:hypothetical protein